MPPLEVRSLQPDDLPALMAVQRAAYGDGFMESTEVFARRLASYGEGAVYMARALQAI